MATTASCSDMPSHHVFSNRDNDPKHTSRLCQSYLTNKESDGVLHQMAWPPQSPDLNPVEMVWNEMERRVKAKGPTSAQHLWELLQDCWETISGDDLMKLMERTPRVSKAVVKAKRGY
uniref:Tc1-like transposase DDE domain-containing protein n=1 Tax=Astatotilapia calliptera TaxID=8154 RepID=A0AAX7SD51_ASTCA